MTNDSAPPPPVNTHPAAGAGAFRRRATGRENNRRSRVVQTMKVALPLAALGILALLAAWPNLVDPQVRKLSGGASDSQLLQPRYYATDDRGQPFSLVAQSARESKSVADTVDLTQPEAEMTESTGSWVTLRAEIGHYNRQTKLLHMVGAVRILKDDGSEYHTEEAFADTPTGNAWGDKRIVGQGPQGEVAAEGFRMTERGKTMVFLNQSAAAVPTAASRGPEKPAASTPAAPAPATSAPAIAPPAVPAPFVLAPPVAPRAAPSVAAPSAVPPSVAATPTASAPAAAPPRPPALPPAKIASPVWTPPPPARKPKPPTGKN